MSRLDGVEIWNSRADRKNKSANAMARELAQKWKKPVTAGSDAHVPEEVGGGVTVLEADELSLSAVKAALLRGAKQVEGRRGRAMCVARSQKTKREKTNAGVKRRVNGMLFTVKCALRTLPPGRMVACPWIVKLGKKGKKIVKKDHHARGKALRRATRARSSA